MRSCHPSFPLYHSILTSYIAKYIITLLRHPFSGIATPHLPSNSYVIAASSARREVFPEPRSDQRGRPLHHFQSRAALLLRRGRAIAATSVGSVSHRSAGLRNKSRLRPAHYVDGALHLA